MDKKSTRPASLEVCILAGGLSTRMGRDKARLRLGGKSLLFHIKQTALLMGLRPRIIRRDLVPRCGPLGGIFTAIRQTKAERVLFLSCDMPFVNSEFLRKLIDALDPQATGAFVNHGGIVGFPLVLRTETLPFVERLIRTNRFALQELATRLKSRFVRPSRRDLKMLLNVNTPRDWEKARQVWKTIHGAPDLDRKEAKIKSKIHSL